MIIYKKNKLIKIYISVGLIKASGKIVIIKSNMAFLTMEKICVSEVN